MNNIFYEFLEKNNLEEVTAVFPINERLAIPFGDSQAQPTTINLMGFKFKIKNQQRFFYFSEIPKPVCYITDESGKLLKIDEQIKELKLVLATVKKGPVTLKPVDSKTLSPLNKTVTEKVISWKKNDWKTIKEGIELYITQSKNAKENMKDDVEDDVEDDGGFEDGEMEQTSGISPRKKDKTMAVVGKLQRDHVFISKVVDYLKKRKVFDSKGVSQNLPTAIRIANPSVNKDAAIAFTRLNIKNILEQIKGKSPDSGASKGSETSSTNHFETAMKHETIEDFISVIKNLGEEAKSEIKTKSSFQKIDLSKIIVTNEKQKIRRIIDEYPKIKKALVDSGYAEKDAITQFIADYNKKYSNEFQWFMENYVNKHFTLKRIFNS